MINVVVLRARVRFWWTSTCKFHVVFSSPLSGHPSPVCQRHYANYGSIHSYRFIHRCPTLFSCKMSTYVIWCTDTNPIGLTNKHADTHRLVEYIISFGGYSQPPGTIVTFSLLLRIPYKTADLLIGRAPERLVILRNWYCCIFSDAVGRAVHSASC